MTTPSSPVDSIAKAMEGEIRRRAVDLVDTLVLERETNGQSKEFMDWAVFMIVQAFNEQRARQAEAMKREMAEKDARIAALEEALKPFAAHQTADGINGPGSLLHIPDEHPLLFNGLGSDLNVTVTVGNIRRARTLLEKNDEQG